MRITLFRRFDEKRLPPHVVGYARPIAWADGISHVALAQKEVKAMNGCEPRWACEAKDMAELTAVLKTVALEPVGKWDFSERPKRKYTKRKNIPEVKETPQPTEKD